MECTHVHSRFVLKTKSIRQNMHISIHVKLNHNVKKKVVEILIYNIESATVFSQNKNERESKNNL